MSLTSWQHTLLTLIQLSSCQQGESLLLSAGHRFLSLSRHTSVVTRVLSEAFCIHNPSPPQSSLVVKPRAAFWIWDTSLLIAQLSHLAEIICLMLRAAISSAKTTVIVPYIQLCTTLRALQITLIDWLIDWLYPLEGFPSCWWSGSRVVPDKIHRAVKRLCVVCVCVMWSGSLSNLHHSLDPLYPPHQTASQSLQLFLSGLQSCPTDPQTRPWHYTVLVATIAYTLFFFKNIHFDFGNSVQVVKAVPHVWIGVFKVQFNYFCLPVALLFVFWSDFMYLLDYSGASKRKASIHCCRRCCWTHCHCCCMLFSLFFRFFMFVIFVKIDWVAFIVLKATNTTLQPFYSSQDFV